MLPTTQTVVATNTHHIVVGQTVEQVFELVGQRLLNTNGGGTLGEYHIGRGGSAWLPTVAAVVACAKTYVVGDDAHSGGVGECSERGCEGEQ